MINHRGIFFQLCILKGFPWQQPEFSRGSSKVVTILSKFSSEGFSKEPLNREGMDYYIL